MATERSTFRLTRLWRSAGLAGALACTVCTSALADEQTTLLRGRESFSTRSLANDHIVFFRPRADETGVEGFVLDTRELVSTLKTRVLTARGLEEVVQVHPRTGTAAKNDAVSKGPNGSPRVGFDFHRTLTPPFSHVALDIHVGPLADAQEPAWVEALQWLLACAIVLGSYALYRMAKTQLEFAERSRNFVSAVSHELKTPLAAIRMHAEMLENDWVADETKRTDYYRTISRESERLTRLIDSVLTLSRVERKRELSLRRADLKPWLLEAKQLLLPHVEQGGFVLDMDFEDSKREVWFEPDALKQVLFNLVDNALKYGKNGNVRRVSVRGRATADGVILTVQDGGPGVKPGDLRRIFQPFYRAENELTRTHPGIGIGLSLVEGLVLAMGGSVTAENLEPGFAVHVHLKHLPEHRPT
jgi:signal transduction histidine kinase